MIRAHIFVPLVTGYVGLNRIFRADLDKFFPYYSYSSRTVNV